jgi:cytochrome c oxidase subunit 3
MTFQVTILLVAIVVWCLLITRLQHKPWTQRGVLPASQDALTSNPAKVGLWLFLAVVTSLFLLLNSAYWLRMKYPTDFQPWTPVDEPAILWVNTFMLMLASIAMQIAKGAALRSEARRMQVYYLAAGALTILFLAGQVLAWRQLSLSGPYGATDPAYAFFILLTATHGLHLTGGLFVLGRTATRIWVPAVQLSGVRLAAARQSVQLTAIYWHFLLIVWLALFALLSAT